MWQYKVNNSEWKDGDSTNILNMFTGETINIFFKFIGEMQMQKHTNGMFKITTGCDCTTVNFDEKNQILSIKYKAKPIPKGLVEKNIFEYYITNPGREIVVQYTTKDENNNDIYQFKNLYIQSHVKQKIK